MAVYTTATAEQARQLRSTLNGKGAAERRQKKPGPKLIDRVYCDRLGSQFVQITIPFVARSPNTLTHRRVSEQYAKRAKLVTVHALTTLLRDMTRDGVSRTDIINITLVRFSPKTLDRWDNLRVSFKPVLDALCLWIVEGPRAPAILADPVLRKTIGTYDDRVVGTGRVTLVYEQEKWPKDKTALGIQIRLHMRALSG